MNEQGHITPLEAPPGPSTGDVYEYHLGARGHSLECCEEFKKEIANLTEKGLVERKEILSGGSHQPYDPSELNLDNILEGEMDLDDLLDEGDARGYYMEKEDDEWGDIDFSELLQFPCLIVPRGFMTPEFEIFYENRDPEAHLQKYGEKMASHRENELLMISVFPESLSKQAAAWFYQLRDLMGWEDLAKAFLEWYRFNPHSILEYLALKEEEGPYVIPDPGVKEVIVKIKEESDMSSLSALTEEEEEEKAKLPPPVKDPENTTTTKEEEERAKPPPLVKSPDRDNTAAEEVHVGPMVEELSINAITEEGDSTTPPIRHY